MASKQTVRKTVRQITTVKVASRGLAALPIPTTQNKPSNKAQKKAGAKRGRPKGSKDTKPRKTRSDKGRKRGSYRKRSKR